MPAYPPLGELTSSLAHEINQPLTALTTNAQASRRYLAGTARPRGARGRARRHRIDAGQITDVLMGLVANARAAMPEGGTLTICTRTAMLEEAPFTQLTGACPGSYVAIAVRDTGVGMTDATLAHAFEPFFTMKDVGHGNGLGLSVAYSVRAVGASHTRTQFRVWRNPLTKRRARTSPTARSRSCPSRTPRTSSSGRCVTVLARPAK